MTRNSLLRRGIVAGVFAVAGCLVGVNALLANDDDDDDRHHGQNDQRRPPQVLPQGFESTDQLLRDIERAERGPEYSAWIVESSRFMNVPHRSFTPDVGDPPFIDLPVNVGIIKGPNGDITLADSGWKQLAYIFDWNTSCCWYPIRKQMEAIGLDPDSVVRIVAGHGHWDHVGQLSEFPNAVLYIQKEELRQIDFFLNYPVEFNQGNIRAVNTIDPLTGHRLGHPSRPARAAPFAAIRRRRCRRFWARS